MATNQTYSSYPSFNQEKNYASGGGGTLSTQQFRPAGSTQTADQLTEKKQQLQTGGMTTTTAIKPPPPGVPTQAPSPAVSPVQPPAPVSQMAPNTFPASAPGGPAPQIGSPPMPTGGGTPATAAPPPVFTPSAPTAPPTPGTFTPPSGTGAPSLFNVEQLISQLVQNPAMARRQGAQDTFGRLTGVMQERLNEDAARRGMDFSSVPGELFAEQSGQLAAQMQEREEAASADDFVRALSLAQGFGQQGIDNAYRNRGQSLQEFLANAGLGQQGWENQMGLRGQELQEFLANQGVGQQHFSNQMGLRDQDLQELMAFHGIGQQDFNNQMTLRDDFYRQLQMLMGLGDFGEAPLGTAVGSGFDYSGAMGQQAGGTADFFGQFAGLLPYLGGGGTPTGGTPPITPGTPPFTPGWQGSFLDGPNGVDPWGQPYK
jgi:hypothetical protein